MQSVGGRRHRHGASDLVGRSGEASVAAGATMVGAGPGWSFLRDSTDGHASECLPQQNSAAAHAAAIDCKVESGGARCTSHSHCEATARDAVAEHPRLTRTQCHDLCERSGAESDGHVVLAGRCSDAGL